MFPGATLVTGCVPLPADAGPLSMSRGIADITPASLSKASRRAGGRRLGAFELGRKVTGLSPFVKQTETLSFDASFTNAQCIYL
jgi:hypothetical protein